MSTVGRDATWELESPFAELEAEPELVPEAPEGEIRFEELVARDNAAARPARAAIRGAFYVRVKGSRQGRFRGDGSARGQDGWIAGLGFEQQVSSPRDVGRSPASDKLVQHPIVINLAWGAASPQFLSALATNEPVLVEVEFVDAEKRPFQRVKLTNAAVTALRRTAGAASAVDQVSFAVRDVEVTDLAAGTTSAVHAAAGREYEDTEAPREEWAPGQEFFAEEEWLPEQEASAERDEWAPGKEAFAEEAEWEPAQEAFAVQEEWEPAQEAFAVQEEWEPAQEAFPEQGEPAPTQEDYERPAGWAEAVGEVEVFEEAPKGDGWATETYEPAGSGVRPCDDRPRLA